MEAYGHKGFIPVEGHEQVVLKRSGAVNGNLISVVRCNFYPSEAAEESEI
jgi:hypothetical protein